MSQIASRAECLMCNGRRRRISRGVSHTRGEKGSCQLYKGALANYPYRMRSHPCIPPRGQSILNHNEKSHLFSESVRGANVDMFCGLMVGVVALCRGV